MMHVIALSDERCLASLYFPGLTMQLDECKDGYASRLSIRGTAVSLLIIGWFIHCSCQYFVFEHSPAYQSIQFRFWDAVETFDPNTIGVS